MAAASPGTALCLIAGLLSLGMFPAHSESVATFIAANAQEQAKLLLPNAPLEIQDSDYPFEALFSNDQGPVVLNLSIGNRGQIVDAKIAQSSGSAVLDRAAERVAKQRWSFSPIGKAEQANPRTISVRVDWKLPLISASEFLFKAGEPAATLITEGPLPLTRNTVRPSDYPIFSVRAREEGETYIAYQIRSDGTTGEMEVVESSGHTRLDEAAKQVVSRWKFTPAKAGNTAVEYWTVARIVFQLRDARFCADRPAVSAYDRHWSTNNGKGGEDRLWLSLSNRGTVIDGLIETKLGWMRLTRSLAETIKPPAGIPRLVRRAGATDCWIRMPN